MYNQIMLSRLPQLPIGIFFLFLGALVIKHGPKQLLNRLLALICLGGTFWLASLFLMTVPWDLGGIKQYLSKIVYTGATMITVFYVHFTSSMLKLRNKNFLKTTYVLGVFFLILIIFTEKIITTQFFYYSWGPYPIHGPLNPLYLMYVLFLFMYCLWHLGGASYGKKRRNFNQIEKNKIKYVFWAFLIGNIGAVDFIPNYGIEFYPFGYLNIAVFISVIVFAIIKHQLLDIEIIIKKTLVFAGLFAASYAVFASFAYVGTIFFENIVHSRWMALVPSVLAIVLMVRPLENFLINITDKYLFQKKYDYKELLKLFSDEVLTVLELDKLVNLTVDKLVEFVKLNNAAFLLYDEEKEEFDIAASAGEEGEKISLKINATFVTYMQRTGRYILLEDPMRKEPLDVAIAERMKGLKAVLAIPLMNRNNLIGVLILGGKKSDENFTQDDIDVLLPLARTLSIAIANAQLFTKLSQAQAQAAQREKMAVIGTLSAGINHEICNPLGIARGQCEMFLLNMSDGVYKDKSHEELLDKAKVIMQKVMNETDRATVITRKLSSFAKPAKGEISHDVQVEKEVEEVIALIEHDLKLDNILIEKEIRAGLPYVSADRKQIQEIFFNIIRNAAQAIKGNGKITIRAKEENGKIKVDVEDTGTGISQRHLDQIFNPFFTTKEPGKGTGLGLFIVKQIVERNNGRISVESEVGKGTIFHIAFETAKIGETV